VEIKTLKQKCGKLKVLYVEDDEVSQESVFKLLKLFFNEITVASDGLKGLEKFNKEKFNLIISDIIMPQMNGIEMLKEIRKIDNEVPALFFSAFNDSKYFIELIELGVDAFILKPINDVQFLKAIGKVVENIEFKRIDKDYKEFLEHEVKERTKELVHKLYYDELTGLLNRHAFFEEIKKSSYPVIFLIDINEFKTINQVYGNPRGSIVLTKFASFLEEHAKEKDYSVYRISGDEFALVDYSLGIDLDSYEDFINNLFTKVRAFQVEIENYKISIDITIGISAAEQDTFEKAKIALEYAKEHNKKYFMYSLNMDTNQIQNQMLICRDEIVSAIQEKRVIPFFQPILDREGKIIKYEALMRIQSSDPNKILYPKEFLETAIKTKLYEELSSSTIFLVLEKLKNINEDISINFTYSDIDNKPFMYELEKFLSKHRDLGKRIIFEITESESIKNNDNVKQFIKRFRYFGVRIAIDDFGSGFSNFIYILEIVPDYLKIDGSLIKAIDTDPKSYTLVQAIVEFSHRLGIKTIAEYVHSKVIFEMLQELNVDEFQGFYFSEPLSDI